MLGQAAAVLVSLSALLTPEIIGISLLAFTLDELLTFARSSRTCFANGYVFIVIHFIVLVVFNGAFIPLCLTVYQQGDSMGR